MIKPISLSFLLPTLETFILETGFWDYRSFLDTKKKQVPGKPNALRGAELKDRSGLSLDISLCFQQLLVTFIGSPIM